MDSHLASRLYSIKYQAVHLSIKRCGVLLVLLFQPENMLALAKTHNTPRLKLETPLGKISPSIMPKHNVSLSGKTLEETIQLDFYPPLIWEKSLGQQAAKATEED